jgi:segregation and condensation protein A
MTEEPMDAAPIPPVSGGGPSATEEALVGFHIELPEYAGPLDLLLALIRDERLDIYDIPIARICAQFVARIHALGLNEAAEYLEMAARLLRIKVQLLLPRSESEEGWDDPRAELVRRLLEYQQIREAVDVLDRLGEERRNRFARAFLPVAGAPPAAPLAMSLVELLAAVDRVLRVAKEPAVHDVIPRALDVDSAIRTVREVLALRQRARWSDVLRDGAEPWEVLSTLMALLELARRGELRIQQLRPFAAVEIASESAGEAA